MIETHLPALIALNFLLFALLIPLFGLWKRNLCQPLAAIGAGLSALLSVYGWFKLEADSTIRYFFGAWPPPVGIEFVYDGLSAFFLLTINLVAFIVLIHSGHISKSELKGKRLAYYSLTMLMMLGFNGMVLTGDLFNLFVFLEISALATYALISIGEKPAPYAAFRYLIIGTTGGTLYLLGVGFLYTVSGSLNLIDIAAMIPEIATSRAVITALILMIVGIAIKAALFPMHGWLPDSYTFTNSISSSLVAPIGTKVAAYVLFRISFYLFGIEWMDLVLPISTIIGVLAVVGILYGSIMAIAQHELKRMLAYSSISQIGYILMGIGLANPFAFAGALLHVLNHAVMKACLFLIAANLREKEGHSDIRKFDHTYKKKYPWTMAAFTLAAISMIGLPPLAGFFSKWYLVLGTIEAGNWIFLSALLVSSLLNAVYFFRILERVYMKDPDHETGTDLSDVRRDEVPFSMLGTTFFLGIGLLLIGLFNAVIVTFLLQLFPAGV